MSIVSVTEAWTHRPRCSTVNTFALLAILLIFAGETCVRPATPQGTTSAVVWPAPVWKRHTIDHTSKGADGVKLGDIDQDGLPDMVTGWEEGGEVRLYLNPGPARSRQSWPRVTVGTVADPEDAIFADLDGDGRLEVVSCTEGKTRTVFWHRPTGTGASLTNAQSWSTVAFPVTRNAQAWMQAAVMDIDGEHGLDLLLASKAKNGAVGWLQAPKSPTDLDGWKYHLLRQAVWVMSLTPWDLDGDGDWDVLFTDRKGPRRGLFWLENPGAKANRQHAPWKEHAIGALGRGEVMFADPADINGDGLLDVAVAVKPAEVILCLRQPAGNWSEQVIRLDPANIGRAKAVKAADVNNDGATDLFFTCEGAIGKAEGIVWLEQHPAQPWRQHPLGGQDGVKYDLMQVLDLDADGDLDVVTCEESDQLGLIWYENPLR